jgi:hypothetical protein
VAVAAPESVGNEEVALAGVATSTPTPSAVIAINATRLRNVLTLVILYPFKERKIDPGLLNASTAYRDIAIGIPRLSVLSLRIFASMSVKTLFTDSN